MLKYLKEDWPGLLIYLAFGIVMVLTDLTILTWQYWALLFLFVALGYWTRAREFDKYFHQRMEMCNQCPYMKETKTEIPFGKYGFMPPSSDPSAPEGTSPHDPKPPQP